MPNVSGVKSKQIVFGTDTDAISAAATATTLVLLNSGPWVNAQTVTLTSTGNNAGITFVVVGKDANGDAATSAATTGPDSTTLSVAGTWTEVTSITASGSITTDISAGITSGATTGIIFAGRTRVRGMHAVNAGAGTILFNNSSIDGSEILGMPVDAGDLDPYIPDDGMVFDSGAFIKVNVGVITGLTVFFDG